MGFDSYMRLKEFEGAGMLGLEVLQWVHYLDTRKVIQWSRAWSHQ
jgi:hypothetical protein